MVVRRLIIDNKKDAFAFGQLRQALDRVLPDQVVPRIAGRVGLTIVSQRNCERLGDDALSLLTDPRWLEGVPDRPVTARVERAQHLGVKELDGELVCRAAGVVVSCPDVLPELTAAWERNLVDKPPPEDNLLAAPLTSYRRDHPESSLLHSWRSFSSSVEVMADRLTPGTELTFGRLEVVTAKNERYYLMELAGLAVAQAVE